MREEDITRVTLDPNNPSKGNTDWEEVDGMTEEEIRAAALSDPDAQPVTPKELEEFKQVTDQDLRKFGTQREIFFVFNPLNPPYQGDL